MMASTILNTLWALLLINTIGVTNGFTVHPSRPHLRSVHRDTAALLLSVEDTEETARCESSSSSRRDVLGNMMGAAAAAMATLTVVSGAHPSIANAAVQRAVPRKACRDKGNCLETGQLDGALGWEWGASDRCDPSDPRCGANGDVIDAKGVIAGKPVPTNDNDTNAITHVATIQLDIGRSESGTIKIGLYGKNCPGSVQEMVALLGTGLATTSPLLFEEGMGVQSAPVSLRNEGAITNIVPGKIIEFGVPSQSVAYARSRAGNGKTAKSIKENFVPQPRPNIRNTKNDIIVRNHDVAGLVSIPWKGIGYGGTGFEQEDEAFESSFQIIAAGDAKLKVDKQQQRRVIGQVMDNESMSFLARIARIPPNKGMKGIIPGQISGPPLIKVSVKEVNVELLTEDTMST